MTHRTILAMALVAASGMAILLTQLLFAQQGPAGPYTADQAAAGRTAYQANCASCHAADLSGREGPQLAGANFIGQWGDRTVGALINFMQSTMPPGGAALPGDTYINLAAFILDANAREPGAKRLRLLPM
jgi:S-disulfanyl-L-cysteine oxidoreductase SoxD